MRCILLPLQILATVWPAHSIVDTCDVCGRHPLVAKHGQSEQVVGGVDSEPGAWPWVVSLQLPTITGHKHSCGGTLVSARWILTAAHCFQNKRDLPHWRAVIGAWKLSSLGSEAHVRYIKRIAIHDDYQRSTETSDIALMELEQPVKCSDYIQPACLPDMTVTVSLLNHCYISGWGILGKTAREVSDVMHEVRVNRFSVAQCNSSSWYNGAIEQYTLCAGYEEGGADICQGDSGGPLMCQEDGAQPFWIIGITSWGQGCGQAHKPGVYTDTQHFYPWIKQLAGPMPQPPPTPMPIPTIKVPLESEPTPEPTSPPQSSPSTPEATQTPTESTSKKNPLVFFWPPSTVQQLLQSKTQPLSQSTSEAPSSPTSQPHATSSNTLQIEVFFETTQAPQASPSSSSPTHTSQVLSSLSSSHADGLPESTVQPETAPVFEIEVITEPTSTSPSQPPTPSETKVTSLLSSIIQSALQMSPQPPSPTPPKSETSSHTTSQVPSSSSSSSSSPQTKVLPESTVQPETAPVFEIEVITEPISTSPSQPATPSETKVTSLLSSIIQSALQISPQPPSPTPPKSETSSHTPSQVPSSSSSPQTKVLPESTVEPETTPVLEIEIITEPKSTSPPQPPTPTPPKTETSNHTTTQVPSASIPPHTKVLYESPVQPETLPEIVSEPVSKTPPQPPSPLKTEGTPSLTPVIQSTTPQHNTESLPKPEIPTEVGSTSQTESQPSPGTNPEPEVSHQSITASQAPPSPQTESEPELEATTQPMMVSQTTSEATEIQHSPQTTSEPPSVVQVVLGSTSEAPTHSETQLPLHTEPKLEPEIPLLAATLHPATSPPTSHSPETAPQPETSRPPQPEAHLKPPSPEAPSLAGHKLLPIIEIYHTDSIVRMFLSVVQKLMHIIKNQKNVAWAWPDLSNLKLIKDRDLASLQEQPESPPEGDLPGESW